MVCNHMTWEEIQSATWEKNQNPKILYTPEISWEQKDFHIIVYGVRGRR